MPAKGDLDPSTVADPNGKRNRKTNILCEPQMDVPEGTSSSLGTWSTILLSMAQVFARFYGLRVVVNVVLVAKIQKPGQKPKPAHSLR